MALLANKIAASLPESDPRERAVSAPNTSIVVEMDNAAFASEAGALENVRRLVEHVSARPAGVCEFIVAHPGEAGPGGADPGVELRASLGDTRGVEVRTVAVTGGRYYELKNAGAMAANGDVVVFVDSDVIPADDWIERLVEPFRDPATVAACGHTSLRLDSFLARVFSLCWFFPPTGSPLSEMRRGGFFANNVAFRTAWFRNHPFPSDEGFKNAHIEVERSLRQQGIELVLCDARVEHVFWTESVRGVLWRAGVDGRDADRKAQLRHGPARWRRTMIAVARWLRMIRFTISRAARYGRTVGLRPWELPAALFVGTFYWTLTCAWQLGAALGIVRRRLEEIPEFVA